MATAPLPSPPAARHGSAARWLRRAFAGLTWQQVALVIAFGAIWSAYRQAHDVMMLWESDEYARVWLIRLAEDFACILAIALVMGAPIVAVGNLGPQSGWRRVAALAAAVALTAPLGAAVRFAYMEWSGNFPDDIRYLENFVVFWFRYAQLAGLLTAVAEFHRREQRSVQAMHGAEIDREALDREMAQARLQVLQAQIEPHFLFNTLANVRRLYETDIAAGRAMLDNLMRYLEVALPRMREERSTVGRELALAEAYLNVQRIRMGRRLAFAVDVPRSLHALDLPPMMLLTLVENAVKHGLAPLPEGGAITISARREGARVQLDVGDTGRGFHATSGGGTGLANIRARLAAMHGADAASLSLAANEPRGVIATLRLPVVENAGCRREPSGRPEGELPLGGTGRRP